jgi:hypothetical protein
MYLLDPNLKELIFYCEQLLFLGISFKNLIFCLFSLIIAQNLVASNNIYFIHESVVWEMPSEATLI